MDVIEDDPLFVALTRPQMFAGVTYSLFVANTILILELYLIFRTFWVLPVGLAAHVVAMLLCAREPRFFDLWLARVGRCPRIPNYRIWRCNSYRP